MAKIGIVGAGLIGRSWATVFACSGFDVGIYDAQINVAEEALAHIERNLNDLADHGLVDAPDVALTKVKTAPSLAAAVDGALLVQESGPENVDIKRELFQQMDEAAASSTILASSTSFIVASQFSEKLKGRSRCLVAHPVNPPHLVPIVELAPAPWTDKDVLARARRIYEDAGQVPVELRKEIPGFVLNRLQSVLLAEAFRLVGEGVVNAEDVDKTIRDGLGLRWSFMGPFETIELNAPGGIPDYCARYASSLARMAAAEGNSPFNAATIGTIMSKWTGEQTAERISRLTNWRDGRLAALRAHKRAATQKPA